MGNFVGPLSDIADELLAHLDTIKDKSGNVLDMRPELNKWAFQGRGGERERKGGERNLLLAKHFQSVYSIQGCHILSTVKKSTSTQGQIHCNKSSWKLERPTFAQLA